nr:hypothetical protein [Tanacetum cinerariifolium]
MLTIRGTRVVHDEGVHVVNEESGDVVVAGQVRQRDHVFMLEGLTSVYLPVEVGAVAVATLLFITSSVSLTQKREGGGQTDSVTRPNLHTQRAVERFLVLLDSFYHSSTNAANDELTFIVMSSVPPSPVLTTTVITIIIDDATSALTPRAGPSHPADIELSVDSFFVSQDVDLESLRRTYIPEWNVTNYSALDDPDIYRGVIDHLAPPVHFSQLRNMDYKQLLVEFNVRAARQTCLSSKVRMQLEHDLKGRKKFEGKCAM